MLKRLLSFGILLVLLLGAAQRRETGRIVAIGDVHGDLSSFTAILQKTGLIDKTLRWAGETATLVLLGDLIDRGPESRRTMDLVMELQREASRRGGNVRVSLGNHEIMVIMGDMRYVVAEDYAAFADGRSEQRRRTAFQSYARFLKARGLIADEAEWTAAHPLGFVELREAFGPAGKYGKWLRSQPVVNRVGDSIFLHGGISPSLPDVSVEGINTTVANELVAFDKFREYMTARNLALAFFTFEELIASAGAEVAAFAARDQTKITVEDQRHFQVAQGFLGINNWLTIRDNGPVWFREYDRWSDEEGDVFAALLTEKLKAQRLVVGHTIQPEGNVRQRFGGKVFLIDTGMLGRKQPAALEISGSRVRAIYLNRVVDFPAAGR